MNFWFFLQHNNTKIAFEIKNIHVYVNVSLFQFGFPLVYSKRIISSRFVWLETRILTFYFLIRVDWFHNI